MFFYRISNIRYRILSTTVSNTRNFSVKIIHLTSWHARTHNIRQPWSISANYICWSSDLMDDFIERSGRKWVLSNNRTSHTKLSEGVFKMSFNFTFFPISWRRALFYHIHFDRMLHVGRILKCPQIRTASATKSVEQGKKNWNDLFHDPKMTRTFWHFLSWAV